MDNSKDTKAPCFRNLTIRDLLIVSFSVAAFVTIYSSLIKFSRSGSFLDTSASEALLNVWIFNDAVVCGITATSIIWFREIRQTFGRYFLHPGHWLLVTIGISAFGHLISLTAICTFESGNSLLYFAIQAISQLTALVCWCCYLFAFLRHQSFWKLFFLVRLIPISVTTLILIRFFPIEKVNTFVSICILLIGVFFMSVVAIDYRKSIQRDWLHWLGLFLTFTHLVAWPIFGLINSLQKG